MKIMKTATLFVLLAVVRGSLSQDYCDICTNHTMCIYKKEPGQQCQPLYHSGVSDIERKRIVNLHNQCRKRTIAAMWVPGSNFTKLPLMTWDEELATVAQRWASQCNPGHDACRNVERFSYVGQNVVVISTKLKTGNGWPWENQIDGLTANWPRAIVGCELRSSRYSRAAWTSTTKLGCGFAQFQDVQQAGTITSLYVCNYAPGGDEVFGPDEPYKPEVACSQCHGFLTNRLRLLNSH